MLLETIGCLAALTVGAIPVPAGAAIGARYVALGDSYSAGVGAGGYIGSSGSCERSAGAYPQLWDAASAPVSYAWVACAGATTRDVLTGQIGALGAATTLVSITIGGNDAGFGPVMTACVLFPTPVCVAAIRDAEAKIASQLPGQLGSVLAAIARHAPNARVVVLGYPELYDLSRSSGCIGLSTTDRVDLNQAADQLDVQLRAAALRYHDTFADVRPAFAGHQICDSGSWLHSVDWLDPGVSYHPTASGQSEGYYPVFAAAAGGA